MWDNSMGKGLMHRDVDVQKYLSNRRKTILLIELVLSVVILLAVSGSQAIAQGDALYSDIWYREFSEPQNIADMFFSDQEEWGNEPVLLLFEADKKNGRAKGFFSGKSMKVYRIFSPGACSVQQGYQYYYSKNKRKMARKYIPPQDGCASTTHLFDGETLSKAWDMTLQTGEMETGLIPEQQRLEILAELAKKEKSNYQTAVSYRPSYCEPLGEHLIKRSSNGNVIWSKSLVRFYPQKKTASTDLEKCDIDTISIESRAGQQLLLADGSILVVAPGSVVRIRQDSGSMPLNQMPTTMKILDASDVIQAKLAIMRRQALAIQQCRTEGKPLKVTSSQGVNGCSLYETTGKNCDRLQSDLAKELNFQ